MDVERLRGVFERTPGVRDRLFTAEEIAYCENVADPLVHFAGTLAAKEATVKALGLESIHRWAQKIFVTRDKSGAPAVTVEGEVGGLALSISHDGGIAIAVVIKVDWDRSQST